MGKTYPLRDKNVTELHFFRLFYTALFYTILHYTFAFFMYGVKHWYITKVYLFITKVFNRFVRMKV